MCARIRAKAFRCTLALLFLEAAGAVPAWAWGKRAHELVTASAIEKLPEPLRSYFRARQAYFLEHASDPDRLAREGTAERPHHYAEVEAYDAYPFAKFREFFVVERREPTPAQLEHGDLVWMIERTARGLAAAWRAGRWDEADRAAVFAAHYAADLTQPLHTVLNYDGQSTGQNGIHWRFEVDLVNAFADRWVLSPGPATVEGDLRARIFAELQKSYSYRNPIFGADRIAVFGRGYRAPQYLSEFGELLGLLVRKRLEAAASFVGSVWYTAWVQAGKPDLKRQLRAMHAVVPFPGDTETPRPDRGDSLAGRRLDRARSLPSRPAAIEGLG